MINKVGKPLKFKSPAELKKVIEDYFNSTPHDEWTVTGLSLLVGSKQLLNDYEKRDGYKEFVVTAKLIVENSYELSLRKHGRTGDIFALKNFGWKDVQDKNVNINDVTKIKVKRSQADE